MKCQLTYLGLKLLSSPGNTAAGVLCQEDATVEDHDSISSSSSDEEDILPDTTPLDYALMEITNIITCLQEFSATLRQPALRDRLAKCRKIDMSHYEFWDKQHVSNKFPNAPRFLTERLGLANTKRRQLLKYHQLHHSKIARFMHADADFDDGALVYGAKSRAGSVFNRDDATVFAAPECVPPSATILSGTSVTMFKPLRSADELLLGHQAPEDDTLSCSAQTQTSYAPSAGSNMTQTVSNLLPPPCPGGEGAYFVCPYCFDMIRLKNQDEAWKYARPAAIYLFAANINTDRSRAHAF